MSIPARCIVLVGIAALAMACTGPMAALHVLPHTPRPPISLCDAGTPCDSTITATFLGVGGMVFRSNGIALMTAPSFTHPRLLRVFFGFPIRADTALIDERMAQVDTANIAGILVGHSHYDHLLDVPYVARHWLPNAKVYGTPATKHVLHGDREIGDARVIALEPEQWHYIGGNQTKPARMRIMALRSDHAPNFWIFTIAPWRHVTNDYNGLPGNAWRWPIGEVYAYIIDVIRPDSTPAFRIFYQDAASSPEYAQLPPLPPRDQRRVDLAVLAAGNFKQAKHYPTATLGADNPRYALIGHWENFFRSPDDALGVIPFTDTKELERRMFGGTDSPWSALMPLDQLTFRYAFGAR